ncbi:hypothetical protein WJX74_009338 [Apatococcus lobatus]|uniref:Ankyrin repeat protein n=1 Tax=Apatococcus lobatus TaxID=904363 RepID=A0AAW1Q5P5_9CHLO
MPKDGEGQLQARSSRCELSRSPASEVEQTLQTNEGQGSSCDPAESADIRLQACKAAREGNIDCLSWLIQNGCSSARLQAACCAAAGAGQVDVLRFLAEVFKHFRGCLTQMVAAAASTGQIIVLEYVASLPNIRHGPWDSSATSAAAKNNQMEVMKWLRAQDLPCMMACQTYTAAAIGGHVGMLKYIEMVEPECTRHWDHACLMAILHGRLEALQHLIATHSTSIAQLQSLEEMWIFWVQEAAKSGHAQIVDFLLAELGSILCSEPANDSIHLR